MRTSRRFGLLTAAFAVALCTGCNLFLAIEHDARERDAGGALPDAGGDSGGGQSPDAGMEDSSSPTDAGSTDSAHVDDASSPPDAVSGDDGSDTSDVGEDTSMPDLCGNGMIDEGEECDGELETFCGDLGLEGGAVRCAGDCTFDVSACHACDYYIDPDDGDDDGDGLTPQTAWESADALRNVLGAATPNVDGGGVVCLRRGETMFVPDTIEVTVGGTESSPVVIADYGDPDDEPPRLTTAIEIAGSDLVDVGGGVWRTGGFGGADGVWVDDELMENWASTNELLDGNFFVDSQGVWVRPSSAPDPDDDVGIVMEDLLMRIRAVGGSTRHIQVKNLAFERVVEAIDFFADNLPISDVEIIDCRFVDTEDAIEGYVDDADVEGLRIVGNQFRNSEQMISFDVNGTSRLRGMEIVNNIALGLRGGDIGDSAIFVMNPDGLVVRGNFISHRNGPGDAAAFALECDAPDVCSDIDFDANYVVGAASGYDFHEWGDDDRTRNVRIIRNVLIVERDGVAFDGHDPGSGSLIANNTIRADERGIEIQARAGARVVNNALDVSAGGEFIDVDSAGLSGDLSFDHNVYIGDARFEEDGTLRDFSEWRNAHPMWDANSMSVDDAMWTGGSFGPDALVPLPGSPLIDSGTDVGLATDFGGRPVDPGAVDVGAWERQPED